jgi:hypothetical protein
MDFFEVWFRATGLWLLDDAPEPVESQADDGYDPGCWQSDASRSIEPDL